MTLRVVMLSSDRVPVPPEKGGAIESWIYNISKELAKLGIEIHVISLAGGKNIEKHYVYTDSCVYFHTFSLKEPLAKVSEILLHRSTFYNKYLAYLLWKVPKIISEIQENFGDIDIIHGHYFTTYLPILLLRKNFKVSALIFHAHNELKYNVANNLLIKKSDIIFAVSNFVKRSIIKTFNVPSEKIIVVPNCVDTEFFRPLPKHKVLEFKRQLGIDESYTCTILFIGRIVPEKGLHKLLCALSYVVKKISRVKIKLLIVGPRGQFDKTEVSYWNRIEKLLHELELNRVTLYLGHIERGVIPYIYSIADIVVVPSTWQDPCPSVVLEALACGKPVVAFPVGGIPELIAPEVGILARDLSAKSLAEAIIKAIDLLSEGYFDASKIRERAEKFSCRSTALKLTKIYSRLSRCSR